MLYVVDIFFSSFLSVSDLLISYANKIWGWDILAFKITVLTTFLLDYTGV